MDTLNRAIRSALHKLGLSQKAFAQRKPIIPVGTFQRDLARNRLDRGVLKKLKKEPDLLKHLKVDLSGCNTEEEIAAMLRLRFSFDIKKPPGRPKNSIRADVRHQLLDLVKQAKDAIESIPLDLERTKDSPLFQAVEDYVKSRLHDSGENETEPSIDSIVLLRVSYVKNVTISNWEQRLSERYSVNTENLDPNFSFEDLLLRYFRQVVFGEKVLRNWPEGQNFLDAVSKHFDVINYRPVTQGRKIICPFPFFLWPNRRKEWTVIQYGNHHHVGLAISKKLAEQIRIKAIESSNGKAMSQAEFAILLNALIEYYRTKSTKHIFFQPGYLWENLLPAVLEKINLGEGDSLFFCQISEPISSGVFYKEKDDAWKQIRKNIFTNEGSVLVFDPADEQAIKETFSANDGDNDPGYYVVKFEHGISVPVGIGVSLSLLPALWAPVSENSKKIIWDEIQEFVDYAVAHVLDKNKIETGYGIKIC